MEAAQKTFENNVLDKLSDMVEGDIPDALVEQYVDGAVDNMRGNLAQYGMELEMYLNMMNMNIETFRGNLRPNAEKNVKNTLALEKVAELEKLEPTEEEFEAGYKEMAEAYGMELDKVKEQINKDMLSRAVSYTHLDVYKRQVQSCIMSVCGSSARAPFTECHFSRKCTEVFLWTAVF